MSTVSERPPPGGLAGGAGRALATPARRRTTSGPVFIVFIVVFIACLIAVTIHEGGTSDFLSVDNIREMFVRSVALGIVAAGQTLVILGASLDLSVGLGRRSRLDPRRPRRWNGQDSRIVLGVLAVLLFGAGVGLVNGLVITKLRVNASSRPSAWL